MNSWRVAASKQAQDDFDAMYQLALDQAVMTLTKSGSLYPFAVTVGRDGKSGTSMIDLGPDGPVDGNEVAAVYWKMLLSQRDVLRACSLVLDTRLPLLHSDAIRVDSEHCEGIALRLLAPYRRRRVPRRVTLGEAQVEPGTARVWT